MRATVRTVLLSLAAILLATATPAESPDGERLEPAPPASADETPLPPNVSAGWWSRVQADLRAREYHVTWQERTYLADVDAAWHAPNRAHGLRTYFTDRSIRVIPRTEPEPSWECGLSLAGYGRGSSVWPVAAGTLSPSENRIEYARGDLTEWYVNDPSGLKLGFTLDAPPGQAAAHGEPIHLTLALSGTLVPVLSKDGRAVEFATADGVMPIRFADLRATDAQGVDLRAWMEDADGSETSAFRLVVDDAGAVYPLTIAAAATGNEATAGLKPFGSELDSTLTVEPTAKGSDVGILASSCPDEDLDGFYVPCAEWTAESNQASSLFGWSVGTAGDVNGDGFADVIVGARLYDNGEQNEGRAYVYHGSAAGPSLAPAWTAEADRDHTAFGESVATAGDVNSDGYDDVIVGGPYWDVTGGDSEDQGKVWVFHGSASGLSSTADWEAVGDQIDSRFGLSVATAGYVNDDGYAAVIVGCPNCYNPQSNEGRAFVYHGSASGLDKDGTRPSGTPHNADWTAESDETETGFGTSVATAGDVDSNGYDDVIVGAPHWDIGAGTSEDQGKVWVFHGGPSGLSSTADWTAVGYNLLDYFGHSVGTAGDVNGDGYDDAIVGVMSWNNGQNNEGGAVVYHGSASGLDLDGTRPSGTPQNADWLVESDQVGANFGWSVGTAGDLDSDGYDDVIVGAPYYNYPDNTGAVFVYHGTAAGLDNDAGGSGCPADADWCEIGTQAGAWLGYSVGTAGDVNGDGYADVVVGAPYHDAPQIDEGAIFLYYGGAIDCDDANASCSSDCTDLDGDGYCPPHDCDDDPGTGPNCTSDCTDLDSDGYCPPHDCDDTIANCTNAPLSLWHFDEDAGSTAFDSYGSSDGTIVGATYVAGAAGTALQFDGTDDYVLTPLDAGPSALPSTTWTAWVEPTRVSHGSWQQILDTDDGGWDRFLAIVPNSSNFGVSTGASYWVPVAADADTWQFVAVVFTPESIAFYKNGTRYDWVGTPSFGPTTRMFEIGQNLGFQNRFEGLIDEVSVYDRALTDAEILAIYLGQADAVSCTDADGDGLALCAGDVDDTNPNCSTNATDGDSDGYCPPHDCDDGNVNCTSDCTDADSDGYCLGGGLGTTRRWMTVGEAGDDQLGISVATAGDVNNDTYDDVIVGVHLLDNGEYNEGRVYVYYGHSSGLSEVADWTAESDKANTGFGASVATAGDVNGDGYADVIVGASDWEPGHIQSDEGKVWVFHGSASGLSSAADWTVEGDQAGGRFGYSVATAGDVNNDTYDDVIVGASLYDRGNWDEGLVLIYHGSASGLDNAGHPDCPSDADVCMDVDQDQAQFGHSVATAGDVNNDGYDDVIVGAPWYDNGHFDEGRAFVYHGSTATGDIEGNSPDWTAESDQVSATFSWSVASAGDVNGDGYDDVIVGALHFDHPYISEGAAFVYHGSASGLSGGPNAGRQDADWTAESDQYYDYFGASVATAGDVNGDGYDDVVIGSFGYESDAAEDQEGRAYVYHGSEFGLSAAADWTAESNNAVALFGWSVGTAGDVNGDGYADVIVGAYLYDAAGTDEGAAFVYYGGSEHDCDDTNGNCDTDCTDLDGDGSAVCAGDLDDANPDCTTDPTDGDSDGYCLDHDCDDVVATCTTDCSDSDSDGTPACAGDCDDTNGNCDTDCTDLDGDGYCPPHDCDDTKENCDTGCTDLDSDGYCPPHDCDDDPGTGPNCTTDCTDADSDGYCRGGGLGPSDGTTRVWRADSDQDNAQLGVSVSAAGDVNSDGYADVIVGARYYDNGQTDEGRVFVYYGAASGLSEVAGWVAEGDQNSADFATVAAAGDVNSDGYDDVMVGALRYDGVVTDAGSVFVFHGPLDTKPCGDAGESPCRPADADWAAHFDQRDAYFGSSVAAAGDVNGDGYDDVIVGALHFDHPYDSEGAAFVYHGSASGLSGGPNAGRQDADWTVESDQYYDYFGASVATAGDVNGDGYDDVVIGSRGYESTPAEDREGRAYVYHGSESGLSATADWTAESNNAVAVFGSSVGTAGDVNGDGYADVIVGAYLYDGGETDEGRVYVYHGSAFGLSATADWTKQADVSDTHFGFSVSTAGDVDGDGYSDVIVGGPHWDIGDGTTEDEGKVWVFHGSESGLSSSEDWTAEGDQQAAYFGYAVATAGDVNGDGYDDVIVGASNHDAGETDEGAAFLYYGGSDHDCDDTDSDCIVNCTDADGDGWAVCDGDVDDENPNCRTAPDADSDGHCESDCDDVDASVYPGALQVCDGLNNDCDHPRYGSADPLTGTNESDDDGDGMSECAGGSLAPYADWAVDSDQASSNFGWSVGTAGDVNGDGYADVIVGAGYYDNGEQNEGRAYVYHGSASGPSLVPDWTAESDRDHTEYGYSVATAGDVNGDGYDDVIVGGPHWDVTGGAGDNQGKVWVYYGSASGLSSTADWTAEGDQLYSRFGYSVAAAGYVDDDGYAAVIVGCPNCYTAGQTNEGHAFVYYGSASGLDLDGTRPSGTPQNADWMVESDKAETGFGASVATAGDVDSNGYDDVIVGAPNWDIGGGTAEEQGKVWVFHGSALGLSSTADWEAVGYDLLDYFGHSVGTAGDVNGDGYDDVIVGVMSWNNVENNEGGAVVYHGSASGLDLDGTRPSGTPQNADWLVESDWVGANFGWSVGTAGDLDNDGYDDVIVGAHYYNYPDNTGAVFVYHGTAAGLDNDPGGSGCPADADWCEIGTQDGSLLGHSVGTAGDVNGDGYADVIVGAENYDNGEADEGAAFLYYGGASAYGSASGSDCDDADPLTSAAAAEICDGKDNDCDGLIDEDANLCDFGHDPWERDGSAGNGWRDAAWGDWDGDGDLDLAVGIGAVTGNSGQANRVYENDGGELKFDPDNADPDQRFGWESVETDDTRSVAWGDWDNDGDLDLAVGNYSNQPNRVYQNDDGVLGPAWSSSENDYTLDVAWGDWDGDGDLDLAVANAGANRVYENQGGTLSAAWVSDHHRESHAVAWGDWDGDGDLDLAVGNDAHYDLVYENDVDTSGVRDLKQDDGDSAGWESTETDNARSVAWGDWDNDGDLDLAVGNYGQVNRVYQNDDADSDGRPELTQDATHGWDSPLWGDTRSVAWGDWDGDGDLDLVAANETVPNRVYENDGTGSPTSLNGVGWFSNELYSTYSMAWGDWDDDGDLDLMAANDDAKEIQVFESHDVTVLSARFFYPPEGSGTIALGDWDGDGDLDLASGVPSFSPESPDPPRVWENRLDASGDRELVSVWAHGPTGRIDSLAWGDRDGDGDLDLAAGYADPDQVVVFANSGGYLVDDVFLTDPTSVSAVAWGDCDGDGDLDLAVGQDGAVNYVYGNDGTGNFASPALWESGESDATRSVAWGDWDGDGDLDLAAGNSGQPDRVYANDGSCGFTPRWSSRESVATQSVAWGDWDGDGDLDLAAGNEAEPLGASVLVYENDGLGEPDSLAVAWRSAETDAVLSVAWGDWEGDGDLDLVVGARGAAGTTEYARWYRNYGRRGLSLEWSYGFQAAQRAAWADWDQDGDLDVIIGKTTSGSSPIHIFKTNWTVQPDALAETPVRVHAERPGITDDASLFSSAERLGWDGSNPAPILIPYTLYDEQADSAPEIVYEYAAIDPESTVGSCSSSPALNCRDDLDCPAGSCSETTIRDCHHDSDCPPGESCENAETCVFGGWQAAAQGPSGDGTRNLSASPGGTPHTFSWDAEADDVCSDEVVFRIGPKWQAPDHAGAPVQRAAVCAVTPPFRVGGRRVPWWPDSDGDGYGETGAPAGRTCWPPEGHVGNGGDCNDGQGSVYPGAEQVCDGRNNDCGHDSYPGLEQTNEYDDDGDLYTECDGDCNDAAAAIHPNALDTCDAPGTDEDCDGMVDGGDANGNGQGDACDLFAGTPLATTTGATSASWGDWDNDGDLDLAIGTPAGDSVKVYANDGAGALSLAWSSPGTDDTYGVAWGDWDNDGDLDLAVGNNGQENRVYANDGLGTATSLTEAWTSTGQTDATRSVAWGDWDDDGDLDLAVGNDGEENRVYANDGLGTATSLTETWTSTGQTDATRSVAWGDQDGDGDLDLAVGNDGEENRVYANDGLGTATSLTETWTSAETDPTSAVAWGDQDGDGDLDLAAGNRLEVDRIYENDEADGHNLKQDGSFGWTSSAALDTRDVAWGDRDGDGDLDLAVAVSGARDRVYENTGTSLAASASWFAGASHATDLSRSVAWGDRDGDGDLDLAFAGEDIAAAVRIHESEGSPLGTGATPWATSESDTSHAVAWGDWDSDGDLDLAVANYGDPSRVYENDGGALTPAWSSPYADWTYGLAWGDWDGDGDLDLAVGNYGDPNRVYRNDGGALTLIWSSTETDWTVALAWGDRDGDGDLDLAVANEGGPNRVYANDGLGTYTSLALAWSSAETDASYGVAWGDRDSDLDLDLAFANWGQPNRVYDNDGAGGFTPAWLSPESDSSYAVAWGDRDGDGDLDLACANHGEPNRVYDNDGSGGMTLAWSSTETDDSYGVAWGDPDNDGDLDLAFGNWGQPNRVYDNDGLGGMTLAWSSAESDATVGVAWGDADGDGDLDLAVAGWGQRNRVYANGWVDPASTLPETPLRVVVARPGNTAAAYFYSSAEKLDDPVLIPYTLFDAQSDRAWEILPEYSVSGGGDWLSATEGAGGDGTADLAASPGGTAHTFSWNVTADGAKNEDDVVFRIRVRWQAPDHAGGPVQRAEMSATSPPFRVGDPVWYEDFDGDTYGNPAVTLAQWEQPAGFVARDGDCDDSLAAVYPGAPQLCFDGLNNDCGHPSWPALTGTNEHDDDSDGYDECGGDCDDARAATHPGAPEVNDGLDNQCPGDPGHGPVDEITGLLVFQDKTTLTWPVQGGATQYEVMRSGQVDFQTDCWTRNERPSGNSSTDTEEPLPAALFHYLVRAYAPNPGSWSRDSAGVERNPACN